jgi:hypothetical protein
MVDFSPAGAVIDEAALEQFQRRWATYQKLVDAAGRREPNARARRHEDHTGFTRAFRYDR